MNVVTELLKSSLKLKPKIIALAECPLENDKCMKVKGFTRYAETTATKYGCTVYIQDYYINMFAIGRITIQYITLWTAGTELTMGYQRPNKHNWDSQNEWHRGTKNIIMGDLKLKHQEWSEGINAEERKLRRLMNERALKIKNLHIITKPTTANARGGKTIDVAITDEGTSCKVGTIDIATTQHKAVKIKIDLA